MYLKIDNLLENNVIYFHSIIILHTMRSIDYTFVTCKERIEDGEKKKNELVSNVDGDAVDKLIEKQIDIVGGNRILFDRIDQQFKSGSIELCLLREYCDLYFWRRDFFDNNLPVLKGAWFTDSFCLDVITYQVTHNFDQILDIVCAIKNKTYKPTGLFFGSDVDNTRVARYRIDHIQVLFHLREKVLWSGYFLTDKFLPGAHLRFGDVAHIIMEHHRLGTKKLEEIAMELVVRNNISLNCASRVVLENAANGFYDPNSDIPDNLTDDGKELFVQLKSVYTIMKSGSNPTK